MNIFATRNDPLRAAYDLDNKRLVKMVLETAQLLSSAIWLNGGTGPYRLTHANHPCTQWAAQSSGNYQWLLEYFDALATRYQRIYGREHKSALLIGELEAGKSYLPRRFRTVFVNCARNNKLKIDYTEIQPVTRAYRLYLNARWETDKREPKFGSK